MPVGILTWKINNYESLKPFDLKLPLLLWFTIKVLLKELSFNWSNAKNAVSVASNINSVHSTML